MKYPKVCENAHTYAQNITLEKGKKTQKRQNEAQMSKEKNEKQFFSISFIHPASLFTPQKQKRTQSSL